MTNHLLRRCVDIVMFLALCFVAGTGWLIGYRLAPCSRGGDDGSTLWGLGRHDWGTLHLWAAYIMLALLIVHLFLNMSFIRNVVAAKSRLLLVAIVIAGTSIVLGFMVVPITIQQGGRKCGTTACPSVEDSFVWHDKGSCNAACQQAVEEAARRTEPAGKRRK